MESDNEVWYPLPNAEKAEEAECKKVEDFKDLAMRSFAPMDAEKQRVFLYMLADMREEEWNAQDKIHKKILRLSKGKPHLKSADKDSLRHLHERMAALCESSSTLSMLIDWFTSPPKWLSDISPKIKSNPNGNWPVTMKIVKIQMDEWERKKNEGKKKP